MKKILAIIVAAILVATLSFGVSMMVSATDPEPTIIVSSETANRGGIKDVTISIKNNPGIASLKLKVEFPNGLSLVSSGEDTYDGNYIVAAPQKNGGPEFKFFDEKGNLITEPTTVTNWVKYDVVDIKGYAYQPKAGTTSFKNIPDENKTSLTLNWISPYENVEGDFNFATLRFKVNDDAELGDKNITVACVPGFAFKLVDDAEEKEQDIDFTVENGKITVTDIIKGDVNGDGKKNAQDVTFLRRYLAGGYSVNINLANSDINGDGKVNAQDVTFLRRALAGGYGISLD